MAGFASGWGEGEHQEVLAEPVVQTGFLDQVHSEQKEVC